MAEEEYLELFVAEAIDLIEEMNRCMSGLENNHQDQASVANVLRNLHTLKGNAMGLGLDGIAEMAHVMEDLFTPVQQQPDLLSDALIEQQLRATDKLAELVEAITSGEEVNYKGLRTKMRVFASKLQVQQQPPAAVQEEATAVKNELSETKTAATENDEQISTSDEEGTELLGLEEPTSEDEELPEDEGEGVRQSRISFAETIQVPTRKVDELMNLVGELLIERDTVMTQQDEQQRRNTGFDRLNRIVSDLQYEIMNIRLVKVGFLFNKFTRIVRDVARMEGKEVDLVMEGTQIEIDRNVLKSISDAMVHLVRNAVSHGIETEDSRLKTGKPKRGKLKLTARNENDGVVIEIIDDGKGIDQQQILAKAMEQGLVDEAAAKLLSREEIIQFIFEPGFSNAAEINEISGRGVGMDVVKRAVERIGGRVQVETTVGSGTRMVLHLPSNLSVKGALLFELVEQAYAITINYTEAVIALRADEVTQLPSGQVATYLGDPLPIFRLSQIFGGEQMEKSAEPPSAQMNVIVVRYNSKFIGLVVDKLMQQQEVVEKPLTGLLANHKLFRTATILGNGQVCLILDVPSVFRMVQEQTKNKMRVA